MTDLTVANTILAQLGGNAFRAMTGAKNMVGSDTSLQFQLPRGFAKNKATHCMVMLDHGADLYIVTFMKWNARALEMTAISDTKGVYADDLRRIFTDATGLDCTMGQRRAA